MDLLADIRMMLNDFGVSATLTDVSASTSITVKGIFSTESENDIYNFRVWQPFVLDALNNKLDFSNGWLHSQPYH